MQEDKTISIMDYIHLKMAEGSMYKALSRAEQSMQPLELTQEEADAIEEAIRNGTARPKIPIKLLPIYQESE